MTMKEVILLEKIEKINLKLKNNIAHQLSYMLCL